MTERRVAKILKLDWSSIEGAFASKRKLRLVANENVFECPIGSCLHSGFKSKRGLRKHLDTRHPWYYFFDKEPSISEHIRSARKRNKNAEKFVRNDGFSIDEGFGEAFVEWLSSDLGGGRTPREAKQSARRAMKFLLHSAGTSDSGDMELSSKFVDLTLGSALMITQFLKTLQLSWQMGHAGCFNYLVALGDLMDFRKSQSVTNETLRSFTVTEVYLRRGKRNLSKKKNADWSRNFDLENLIAQNNWASLDEMEKVVPFHLPRFKQIIENCRSKSKDILPSELTFATRFITTLLFLRVKCSRPMTFQHLTIEMIEKAKQEGGFIDQRRFKTEGAFLFDSLLIDENVMRVIDLYIDHCRPLLNPKCDYLLITSGGKMCQNLCFSMTILVHEAIQRYINPTRYRQIVETASSDLLTPAEQDIISQDQKHNSRVAQVYYKKKLSRDIAAKGKDCMEKMTGESRKNTNDAINNVLLDIEKNRKELDLGFLPHDIIDVDSASIADVSEHNSSVTLNDENERQDESLKNKVIDILSPHIVIDDQEVKLEEMSNNTRTLTRFTEQEDCYLSEGIKKHGSHNWVDILKDKNLKFNEIRSRDSLRVRAGSSVFKRKFKL